MAARTSGTGSVRAAIDLLASCPGRRTLVLGAMLELGERTYRLETGDSFHFDSAIPHRYSNPGPDPASTIMALVPMALRYGHAHAGDAPTED